MAENTTKKPPPIQKFTSRGKQVCVWESIKQRDGKPYQTLTATIGLTQYDQVEKKRVENPNLFTQDVPQLAALLQAAFSFMVQREAEWRAEQRAQDSANDEVNN